LYVVTTGPDGAPAAPDYTPYVVIYSPDLNPIEQVKLPITDRPNYGFSLRYILGELYYNVDKDTKFRIVYHWGVGGEEYQSDSTFELMVGGTKEATITSMRTVSRPGGQWIVMHDEAGYVKAGFRPYV
jgi:hypothetical protein